MVMIFRNDAKIDDYILDYRKLSDNASSFQDVSELLERTKNQKNILLTPNFKRRNYLNRYLLFNEKSFNNILDKMCSEGTMSLCETNKKEGKNQLESEIGQGVVPPQDFLNKSGYEKLNNPDLNIGDGIFCLSEKEYESINWNKYEKQIIKPFYTTKQLNKYYACNGSNDTWLIYTGSEFKASNLKKSDSPVNIDNYPNIKSHLDKFSKIITSDNKPYGLHRKREQRLFEGEKIMALRKCSNGPCFTYTDFPCYVSQSYNIITSKRFNLKYLTALLNSKLIAFWLKYRGKMQGTNYQIDNEPLSQIPIATPNAETPFIELVDKILEEKQSNPTADTSKLEKEIDILVYDLYGLTKEEIAIIEGN
jgi:adenine-specific DNA-methyltransferase